MAADWRTRSRLEHEGGFDFATRSRMEHEGGFDFATGSCLGRGVADVGGL